MGMLLILYRTLSGFQLAAASDMRGKYMTLPPAIIFSLFLSLLCLTGAILTAFLPGGLFLISAFAAIKTQSEIETGILCVPLTIHLTEFISFAAFGLALAFSGVEVTGLIASIYPGLFVHRALINKACNRGALWTPRRVEVPQLGLSLPTSGAIVRLILTGVSLLYLVLNHLVFGINITL
jgi:hypothetical protein